jgi:glycosyltransferase involved in cell wall biosynthesis
VPTESIRILLINHANGVGGRVCGMADVVRFFDRHSQHELWIAQQRDDKGAALLRSMGANVIAPSNVYALSGFSIFERKVLSISGVTRQLLNILKVPLGLVALNKILKKLHPDLVVLNDSILFYLLPLIHAKGVKVVVFSRNPICPARLLNIRRNILSLLVRKYSDRIIGISKQDTHQFGKCRKAQCIREAVDFEKFSISKFQERDVQVLRKKYGAHENRRVVAMLGGVSANKGTDVFVESMRQVLDKFPDVDFFIAGNGASSHRMKYRIRDHDTYFFRRRLLKLISRVRLDSNIVLVDTINEIEEIIACSDLIVFPAAISHFARPVIEAWAFQKPVIMTNTPHARELIEDGIDGIVVPLNCPPELADAIVKVLERTALARALGENGHRKVHNLFDGNANMTKISRLFEAVVGEEPLDESFSD